MRQYLFVYGLFRDSARPLLGEMWSCGRANVKGSIYRVNEFYPGYKPDSESAVWGEVFLVDESVFPQLDEFEGEEFTRKRVITSTDLQCWIYEYHGDCSKFKKIKSGDWMLR
jgi:gamma-glutamylcyclotransferase (GGCT)/AIG2-like uncharacterized protein YtfP